MKQLPLPIEHSPTYPTPTLRLLPLRERPLYRVQHDAGACNLVELLAALVAGPRQIEIAHRLLAEFGDLTGLARASARQLEAVPGLGPVGAARLKAALELGQRLGRYDVRERPSLKSPAAIATLVMPEMGLLEQEELRVILLDARMSLLEQEELRVIVLDTRSRLLGVETVYRGNLNAVIVRPVEVFKPAIKAGRAAAIVVAHNHPSSDCSPSPEDVQLTRQLVAVGDLLDITVLDHLIIAGSGYVSLRERGLGFD